MLRALEFTNPLARVYSRREFLARMMWLVALASVARAYVSQGALSRTITGYTTGELEVLAAAMDEIVPAGDGMPSATAAGGLQYLQYLSWQYPNIQQEISNFLATLEAAANQFGTGFPKLQPEQRLHVLQQLEKNHHTTFASFIGYVYEAYYTRPQVRGLISCPASTANADDLAMLLEPVRRMKPLYRETP
jgi:hypothetical protein